MTICYPKQITVKQHGHSFKDWTSTGPRTSWAGNFPEPLKQPMYKTSWVTYGRTTAHALVRKVFVKIPLTFLTSGLIDNQQSFGNFGYCGIEIGTRNVSILCRYCSRGIYIVVVCWFRHRDGLLAHTAEGVGIVIFVVGNMPDRVWSSNLMMGSRDQFSINSTIWNIRPRRDSKWMGCR